MAKDDNTMRKTMTANRNKHPEFCAFMDGLEDASVWLRQVAIDAWRRDTQQVQPAAPLAIQVQPISDASQNAPAPRFDGIIAQSEISAAFDALYAAPLTGNTRDTIANMQAIQSAMRAASAAKFNELMGR